MNIGKVIVSLRKKKNMKQKEFAKEIGISPTSLSLLESGHKQPSRGTIARISEYLKVPEPFIYFLSLEEADVPEEKKALFQAMEPGLKANIEALFLG